MTDQSTRIPRYLVAVALTALVLACFAGRSHAADAVYAKGFRTDTAGWIFVHIEGLPGDRGEQYGFLTAPEIAQFIEVLKVYEPHHCGREWSEFRTAAATILLPKIETEYLTEMRGIVRGMRKAGVTQYDLIDIIAMNAFLELSDYYFSPAASQAKTKVLDEDYPALRCSAFIATGSQTADGKIVLAHNTWADYIVGQRGNVILDLKPARGYRILMQGSAAGFISSGSDFAVNSAGLVISETTIAYAAGFDVNGIPEFIRMRKAAQYADSIDKFSTIMRTGNNGGYANTWLIGDTRTNEIAKLELGLKNTALFRSQDGYFDGMNYVDNSKMIREECSPSLWDTNGNWPFGLLGGNSCSARRQRWIQLLDSQKGRVNAATARASLADQVDPYTGEETPGGYVLMRRREINTAPGSTIKPSGACDGKVVTTNLAKKMGFWARMDHPDGSEFTWAQFLVDNPGYAWQKPYLQPLKNNPWKFFQAARP